MRSKGAPRAGFHEGPFERRPIRLEWAPMSAIDPLRGGQGAGRRIRAIEPIARDPGEAAARPEPEDEFLKCSYRPPGADFFCWKYGVWYGLMDCCYRHERRTFSGCADCGQGASNLKVNRDRYFALHPREGRTGRR